MVFRRAPRDSKHTRACLTPLTTVVTDRRLPKLGVEKEMKSLRAYLKYEVWLISALQRSTENRVITFKGRSALVLSESKADMCMCRLMADNYPTYPLRRDGAARKSG